MRSCGILMDAKVSQAGCFWIETGEEVILRHCALPQSADDQTLRTAIEKAVAEEGYKLYPRSLVRR
jgi:hypothetical protein